MAKVKRNALVVFFAAGICIVGMGITFLLGGYQAEANETEAAAAARVAAAEYDFISVKGMEEAVAALEKDDPTLMLNSNPYGYISDGRNPYYNQIVEQGVRVLPRLETVLAESPKSGLGEYLIAVAIEDVTGSDVCAIVGEDNIPWSAKEFQQVWSEIRENAPREIKATLLSGDLSIEEKTAVVDAYGVLAVPHLVDLLSDGAMDENLAIAMKERIDAWSLTDEEILILRG